MVAPGSGNTLLRAQFRKADLLYQVDALDRASECLFEIAGSVWDGNAKISALARLTRIECDLGQAERARQHLADALNCAERCARTLTETTRGELLAARAWNAVSDGNAGELEILTRHLSSLAMRSVKDDRLWSLAAWANAHASVYKYSRQDMQGALASYERAAAALDLAADAPPFVRIPVLTIRAALDMHDPERVHLTRSENADAYGLALEHGMVASACDALHNTLTFSLYCDQPRQSTGGNSFDREAILDANARLMSVSDAMLAATAAATFGRFDDAIASIERARTNYQGEVFTWTPALWAPAFRTLEARILYKASRFAAAERVASAAANDWERAGLSSGSALRVRAEALEALGHRTAALATIRDALDALKPFSPVHHLLGAYDCAYRLTRRRSYLEPLDYLRGAVRRASSAASAPAIVASGSAERRALKRLTPRERDVALLVVDGHTNPAIARRLEISRKTVANHVATIFDRLELRARWQLTREMIQD